VAEEAFYNLPVDWEIGIGEGEHAGIPYFYNAVTGESDWKHPHEEACFRKVKIAKERKREMKKSKSRMGGNSSRNDDGSNYSRGTRRRADNSNSSRDTRGGVGRDNDDEDVDDAAAERRDSSTDRHSVTVDNNNHDDHDDVVDIQDFNDDDFAEPSTSQQTNSKRDIGGNNSTISSGSQQASKHKSVAFGMSEDDFLDVEPTIGEMR